MYGFEIQKNMLEAANYLLDKKEILHVSALGGGI